jgi:GxxExxY protein
LHREIPVNEVMSDFELMNAIIGRAIEVHRAGLLESAYRHCLYHDLLEDGLLVEMEKPMPIVYKSVKTYH